MHQTTEITDSEKHRSGRAARTASVITFVTTKRESSDRNKPIDELKPGLGAQQNATRIWGDGVLVGFARPCRNDHVSAMIQCHIGQSRPLPSHSPDHPRQSPLTKLACSYSRRPHTTSGDPCDPVNSDKPFPSATFAQEESAKHHQLEHISAQCPDRSWDVSIVDQTL